MVLGYSLLWAYVAEHIQLLLVFSTHAFFLSGCAVETREFRGTPSPSKRVFPHPAKDALQLGSRQTWRGANGRELCAQILFPRLFTCLPSPRRGERGCCFPSGCAGASRPRILRAPDTTCDS